MRRRIRILAAATLVIGFHGVALAADDESASSKTFPVAKVRFEQNATDGDVEAVFDVIGRVTGLTKLTVVSPDGRTVVDFTAPDASTMGMREFVFESPEPTDVEGLKAAYPAGDYTFAGTTVRRPTPRHGQTESRIAADCLLPFGRPRMLRTLSPTNLEITWTPVENVAGYVIELEQSKLDVKLSVEAARFDGQVCRAQRPARSRHEISPGHRHGVVRRQCLVCRNFVHDRRQAIKPRFGGGCRRLPTTADAIMTRCLALVFAVAIGITSVVDGIRACAQSPGTN